MEAGFSKGPWSVARRADHPSYTVVAPDSDDQGIVGTVNLCRGGARPDGEANARLIAAAPELYAALLAFVQTADAVMGAVDWPEYRTAAALLARVRGEG